MNLVETLSLQDLPLTESKFTFFEGGSHSRLDRFLVKDGQFGWLEGVIQQSLFKFSSDHLPIMLSRQ